MKLYNAAGFVDAAGDIADTLQYTDVNKPNNDIFKKLYGDQFRPGGIKCFLFWSGVVNAAGDIADTLQYTDVNKPNNDIFKKLYGDQFRPGGIKCFLFWSVFWPEWFKGLKETRMV